MFFLLSKLLNFLLSPALWLAGLLAFALIAADPLRRRQWLRASLVALLVLANPALSNWLWNQWEMPAVPLPRVGHYDAAILLTGITAPDRPPHDRVYIAGGADRLLHTLQLWREGHIDRIIVSGGSGSVLNADSALLEAEQLRRVLLDCGVPDSLITLESRSRNTRENALFTAELLKKRPTLAPHGRLLLVTSAFHMRRAAGCFRRAGLAPDSFPTDFTGEPARYTPDVLVPNADALRNYDRLIHEVFGYLTYRLLGYC